jgi:hypothetical protein
MAPQGDRQVSPGTRTTREDLMATEKSSASAQPTEDHDDTVETHYASLERPHACVDGWVFLGRVLESEHDLDGQVVEYERVPCRRCLDDVGDDDQR